MRKLELAVSLSCPALALSLPTLGQHAKSAGKHGLAWPLCGATCGGLAAAELLPLWLVPRSYVCATALGEAACGLFEKAGGSFAWISNRLWTAWLAVWAFAKKIVSAAEKEIVERQRGLAFSPAYLLSSG